MSTGHWERVQLLFEQALEVPLASRESFLRESCVGDPALAEEVRDLLAAHERGVDVPSLPTSWLETLAAPEPPRYSPGDVVADRYEIRSLIGRGGMGEVYEAWDSVLSIEVALKSLRIETGSQDSHRLLQREGFLARSVWHPNVCRVYDLGRHDDSRGGTWFLTMERLRGATLASRLRNRAWADPARARGLAGQMALALDAAHTAGVIHRDFKPANVMIVERDGTERAVVTDFGIARPASEEDSAVVGSGAGWGTPAYMAPEQLLGEPGGPHADVYALGVVLYEMVTGAVPFGATLDAARRKLAEPPRSPRVLAPGLGVSWERAILRCLERSPQDRFASAADLIAALDGNDPLPEGPRAAHTSGTHLPRERDVFLGRADEMGTMRRAFSDGARLLTLVGAAGMGKTRLAIRYGWERRDDWPGGVWFCDLKECRDAQAVASEVARALGVPLGRQDPVEQVGQAIAGRGRCLIILDNFDPVVEQAASSLGPWIRQSREGAFLATSREHLRLDEEHTLPVEPLPVELAADLFQARARWLNPGLRLDQAEEEAVRDIVRLVDGMPLAIELAATRTRVMDVHQIRDRIRDRFRLLTGGSTTRHETLEIAIAGSWELLPAWCQAAWEQCSMFEGGFTIEAAEQVLDLRAWADAPAVMEALSLLLDRSLLRVESGGGISGSRFGMYVSLQEYARNRLAERGATKGGSLATETRHGSYYAQFGTDEAIVALDRAGGVERRRVLEREIANVTTACRRARERGDADVGVATYRAAVEVLSLRGPFGPAIAMGTALLEDASVRDRRRAWVLYALSRMQRLAGAREAAKQNAREARELACVCSDSPLEALLTGWLGNLEYDEGATDSARELYAEALAAHTKVGNQGLGGVVLSHLGILDYMQGQYESAEARYDAALDLLRRAGDRRREGYVCGYLGTLHRNRGRFDRALASHGQALAIHREAGDRSYECQALGNLGNLYVEMRRPEDARSSYESAVAMAREMGDRRNEGLFLSNLGSLHLHEGRLDEARSCFETALANHREVGTRAQEGYALGLLARLSHREGRLQDARHELDGAERIMREVHFDLELAKLLCVRGRLELDSSNMSAARTALEEVEVMAAARGWGDRGELGEMMAELRTACGD